MCGKSANTVDVDCSSDVTLQGPEEGKAAYIVSSSPLALDANQGKAPKISC